MSSLRSSVRPASSKQKWGTILKPEFGLGYQNVTKYELDQIVDRLYYVPTPRQPLHIRNNKRMTGTEFQAMMDRLTDTENVKIPDSDRRIESSIYKDMGVVSSYAWQGYN
ncbi:hypothetical protein LOTGIDRAFT_157955 [Lottia gigantea]|uniref:Uncharacterized protein n=1 Tax=Lottia gigantea TaxID=225164 RepID=V4ATP2_LOTGI|nr:hypothetical protein LOTGIDRAFT_157955 [Lottia gigantea]ESP00668.1 hypothetical protein LOTGIDRAFT_157955 [Lottia gigantea]